MIPQRARIFYPGFFLYPGAMATKVATEAD